ncbi:MAG: helix-turn-helix transcriptional regulator [Rhodospirillales bacterium]|nr:helix-turn-helix transcriptional regulator [Rhodospirillales bacterium]
MPKKHRPKRRSACPLNVSLEVFGDRWSLLVVRDLMFGGHRTFKEFLDSGEKIATNVLAERLQRLEANEIIERCRDADDARKVNYALTKKGIALAPVLVEMIIWGARHEETAAPPEIIRRMVADRDGVVAEIRDQWKKDRSL